MSFQRRRSFQRVRESLDAGVLARIIGPAATRQSVALGVIVPLSLTNVVSAANGTAQEMLTWLGVVASAGLVAWAWFTFVGIAIQLTARHVGARATGLAVLFGSTEAIRTVLSHWFATTAGLEQASDWPFYIIAGIGFGSVLFSMVSTLVNDVDSYRRSYRQLAQRADALNRLNDTAESQLVTANQTITDTVRFHIERAVSEVFRTANADDSARVVDSMFAVSDQVVRPLAHELYESPVRLDDSEQLTEPPRVSIRVFFDAATTVPLIRPGTFLLLFLLLGSPGVMFLATSLGSIVWFVAAAAVLWFASRVVSQLYSRVRPAASWLTRFAWMVLAYLAIGAITGAVFGLAQLRFGSVSYASTLFLAIATVLLVGFAGSAAGGIQRARLAILAQLETANAELQWQQVQLQSRIWVKQRRFARLLHAELQGALVAGALKFRRETEQGVPRAIALASFESLVRLAMGRVLDGAGSDGGLDPIAAVAQQWGDVLELSVAIPSVARELLHADLVAGEVVVELLQNALTDAVKHGHATAVSVMVTPATETVLELRVVNNGRTTIGVPTPGIGSRQLQALTLWWRLAVSPDGNGVELVAAIPVRRLVAH